MNPLRHDEGCFRRWIVIASILTGEVNTIPSYRDVWSCCACLPTKIVKRLGHILFSDLLLATAWEYETGPIRQRAERVGAGYAALSLALARSRFIIAPAEFLGRPIENGLDIAKQCVALGIDDSILRLSFNNLYRPTKSEATFRTLDTKSTDHSQVQQAIYDAGCTTGRVNPDEIDVLFNRISSNLHSIGLT